LQITLCFGESGSDFFTATVYNSDFHRRWLDELEWCLINCKVDQQQTFSYFQSDSERKNILLDSIKKINVFFKREYIKLPQSICWDNQEFFNELHLKFEELSGEYGKPTKLFYVAPPHIKQAIRNLNYYIHTIESGNFSNTLYVNFDKDSYQRQPLSEKDYELFEVSDEEAGYLYLGYCELGKKHYDVFKDKLPLAYANTKNLHYYSGEFFISLGNGKKDADEFKSWCVTNGVDYTNKKLGIGLIKLGELNESPDSIRNLLKKHRYLHSIKIERN
jgi:hypothetical protein